MCAVWNKKENPTAVSFRVRNLVGYILAQAKNRKQKNLQTKKYQQKYSI